MQHTTRIIATVAVGIGMLGATHTASTEVYRTTGIAQDSPRVHVRAATPAERDLVRWAVERFEIAGLVLPDLEVSFYDDTDSCYGFQGFYRSSVHMVSVCNRNVDESARARTVLHELAHAWADHNLDDAATSAFLEHRGLLHWSSNDGAARGPAWWQRGSEHAAEIIAWGLMEETISSIWVHTELCTELAEAFELLTGREPLNRSTEFCKCRSAGSLYLQACPAPIDVSQFGVEPVAGMIRQFTIS